MIRGMISNIHGAFRSNEPVPIEHCPDSSTRYCPCSAPACRQTRSLRDGDRGRRFLVSKPPKPLRCFLTPFDLFSFPDPLSTATDVFFFISTSTFRSYGEVRLDYPALAQRGIFCDYLAMNFAEEFLCSAVFFSSQYGVPHIRGRYDLFPIASFETALEQAPPFFVN